MFQLISPMFGGAAAISYLDLTNGSFETGDMTGWQTVTGTPSAATGPSSGGTVSHTGAYNFYGGSAQRTLIKQEVAIQSGLHANIDADEATLDLEYWAASQPGDKTCLSVQFLNGSGVVIGCYVPAYLSPGESTWVNYSYAIKVPLGAKSVVVYHDSRLYVGVSNDGYADDILGTFSVAPPATVELAIINPDATESALGWTVSSGDFTTTTGPSGGGTLPRNNIRYFYPGTTALGSAYQDVSMPSTALTSVDAGAATLYWSYYQCCASRDAQRVRVEFYNASMSLLGSSMSLLGSSTPGYASDGGGDSWIAKAHSAAIPTNTRTVRLINDGERNAGASNDGYSDSLRAWISL